MNATNGNHRDRPPVVFVLGHLPPRTGGEHYDHRLLRHLTQRGNPVLYVDASSWRRLAATGLRDRYRRLRASLSMARLLGRRRGLFIEDEFHAAGMFAANLLRRLLRRGPLIIIVHHLDDSAVPNDWQRRRAYLRIADHVIAVSDFTREQLIAAGVQPSRISVVPNGFEPFPLPRRAPPGPDSTLRLLCVARCEPRKGIEHLVRGLALLPPGAAHLTVAGATSDPHFVHVIAPLAQDLNLDRHVAFLGHLPRHRLLSHYAAADVFVLPSLLEGFGVVLLEAMHAGLAIIATNTGGIPELIQHGHNGLLVPPADPQALADAISRLHLDADHRRALARAGRRTASRWPTWQQTTGQIQATIDRNLPQAL